MGHRQPIVWLGNIVWVAPSLKAWPAIDCTTYSTVRSPNYTGHDRTGTSTQIVNLRYAHKNEGPRRINLSKYISGYKNANQMYQPRRGRRNFLKQMSDLPRIISLSQKGKVDK